MPGFVILQCCHVFLKEVFKLLVGKHFVDQLENGLFIVLVKLLDEADCSMAVLSSISTSVGIYPARSSVFRLTANNIERSAHEAICPG